MIYIFLISHLLGYAAFLSRGSRTRKAFSQPKDLLLHAWAVHYFLKGEMYYSMKENKIIVEIP